METLYINQHLGLGDHILCNGLIREITKNREKMCMFVKERNLISLQFMFSDLKGKMSFQSVRKQQQAGSFLRRHNIKPADIMTIGYNRPELLANNFDEFFYKQHNCPFEKRWSSFYIDRKHDREKEVFKKFQEETGSDLKEYIFFHEDADRNFLIDNNYIDSDLPIVTPKKGITPNIFDYCSLIENATEIHCISSSFMTLIDSIPTKGKLFFHNYSRYEPFRHPILSDGWNKLTKRKEQ